MADISRRQLFSLRPSVFAGLLGKSTAPKPESEKEAQPLYIRPPGALNEEAFLEACTRCDKCVTACPHESISLLGPESGKAEKTPVLNPQMKPCYWCVDMPCITACEPRALKLPLEGKVAPIAKIEINHSACLNSQGMLCEDCTYHCPSHLRAIKMVNRKVVIDYDKCTACGLCAYYCDDIGKALEIKFLNE